MPIREDTPQSVADGLLDKQEDEVSIMPLGYNAYFYRMYRPWYLGEKRLDPIVASSNHINVFTINPDEAIVIPCNVGAMEVASKLVVLNSEEQEQKAIIQREVIVEDNVEFLQDGNWAVALFDPIKDENDLDRLWIFDMVSPKIGYALTDPDLLDDQANEGYRQSTMFGREKQVNVVNVRSVDYFATENKTSIKFILGEPIDLSDFNLQNISLERNGTHSIYTQIKLLGLDTDANEKTFFNLQADLMPFLANVKRVGKEVELNNLWKKGLDWGMVEKLITDKLDENSETLTDMVSLLELPASSGASTKTYKGHITSAPLNFKQIKGSDRMNYLLGWRSASNNITATRDSNSNIDSDKNHIFYLNNTLAKIFEFSGKDKGNSEVRWNGYETSVYGFTSSHITHTRVTLTEHPFGEVSLWDNNSSTQISLQNSRVKKALLYVKTTGDDDNLGEKENKRYQYEYNSKVDFVAGHSNRFYDNAFSQSIYLGVKYYHGKNTNSNWENWGTPGSHPTGGNLNDDYYLYYGATWRSASGRFESELDVCWNDGTEANGGEYDIEVEINGTKDNMRLWNMLIRKITFTKLYANAFSGAAYDNDTGLPKNFAALVKEKFTNTNYSPIDVITNIEKEYLTRYPDDKNTLQWENYKKISSALSANILSDTSIAGGLNEQNQILMPFYLSLPNKKPDGTDNITLISNWVDGENYLTTSNQKYPIFISGSNKEVDETKSASANPITGVSTALAIETQSNNGTTISNLPVWGAVKSKWFTIAKNTDTTNNPNNKWLFTPISKYISEKPSITTDDQEITFSFAPSTKELREGDFTEIPRDWSLNENYTNYLWNILLPNKDLQGKVFNYIEPLIGIIGGYPNITKEILRTQIVSMISNELECSLIPLSGSGGDAVWNGALPYQLIFNGTFGSQTDIRFDFSKDILNEDGTTTTETASIRIPNINIFNDSDDQVVETTLVL